MVRIGHIEHMVREFSFETWVGRRFTLGRDDLIIVICELEYYRSGCGINQIWYSYQKTSEFQWPMSLESINVYRINKRLRWLD